MMDPRLRSQHLKVPRRGEFAAARSDLLGARGELTQAFEVIHRFTEDTQGPPPVQLPPVGGTYTLIGSTGERHSFRVGMNTLGRLSENDIVLKDIAISRRHCVFLVHATGGCEVYDLASRHGTWLNRYRVKRSWVAPGDVLQISGHRFFLAWHCPDHDPPVGIPVPPGEADDVTAFVESDAGGGLFTSR